MEELIYIAATWAMGVFTGLGLGTAIASQREAYAYRTWMEQE